MSKDPASADLPRLTPTMTFLDHRARDQDDLCLWVHPADPARSRVIAADKQADLLIVYDLDGRAIQTVPTPKPGNIDLRYGVSLGGRSVDLVAFNQRREGWQILVFAVNPEDGRLSRVDDGSILTEPGYGGGLFRSPATGRLFFVKTFKDEGVVEQLELLDRGDGKVHGSLVRSWKIGQCEGVVGHDASGTIYIAEEKRGIWALGGEPEDPAPGELVARVGEHGLVADVEGLAVYPLAGTGGYLLASNQGVDSFQVYRLGGDHEHLGAFSVEGAVHTDGIEVSAASLGPRFPAGVFLCHAVGMEGGVKRCPVLATPWEAIADALGLDVVPAGDPRG